MSVSGHPAYAREGPSPFSFTPSPNPLLGPSAQPVALDRSLQLRFRTCCLRVSQGDSPHRGVPGGLQVTLSHGAPL